MGAQERLTKNIESEKKYTSRIRLSFFRHGDKDSSDESIPDYQIRLSKEGRKKSAKRSDTLNIRQSVAFGSPKVRAQETAALRMAGNQAGISGEEPLEELKEKLDKDLGVGSKIGVDQRLGFYIDPKSLFSKISTKNFKDKRYLKFWVKFNYSNLKCLINSLNKRFSCSLKLNFLWLYLQTYSPR